MGCANGSAIQQPIRPQKKRDSVTSQIKKKYKIESNILGAGAFGKVFLATSTTDEKFKVAIKVISKKKIGDEVEQLLEEISILKSLDHPNIIKYYETYENKKYIYIVMEYWPGGELFDVIARKAQKEGCFSEFEASEIIS